MPSTKISALTSNSDPNDSDELVVVDKSDTAMSANGTNKKITWATIKAFLKTYFDTIYPPQDGWISADALIYSSADSPTFLATITGDKTTKYSVGMKMRFEQDQALTAYWNLDSNSNSQVGSFNGTDTAVTYTAGKFGNAATFNGTTSKIVLADNASLKPTGDFTIGCWFKTSNTGAYKTLFQSRSTPISPNAGILLDITSANNIRFIIGNGSDNTLLIGNSTVTDGNWHYLVVSYRNNYVQVYLDGKIEISNYAMTPVYQATNYVRIGCSNATGSDGAFMNGQIDDLFLINGYALDEKTIKAKYDAQTAQGTGNITIKKYGIITKDPTYSNPNTTLTIFCGTDYAMTSGTISNPYFSIQKAPFGFPLNPAKWTIEVSDVVQRVISSPTQNVWANFASIGIVIHIGIWNLEYMVGVAPYDNNTAQADQKVTLSTANNSESDPDLSVYLLTFATVATAWAVASLSRKKTLSIATKTTYYLNGMTSIAGQYQILINNDVSRLVIRAVCALL